MPKKTICSTAFFLLITCIPGVCGAFYGARLEPADGQVYHGAQSEVRPVGLFKRHVDWQGIDAYAKACGRRPRLIMHYITFDPLGFWLLKSPIEEIAQRSYDYIPQIGLDFYRYIPRCNILKPTDISPKIAEGKYDEKIEELARMFVKMKTPVFLRPGYEFGGTGQGSRVSKKHWIKAWRRVHRIFKSAGAKNVAFVWNTLNAVDYMDYYPGDDTVDWWAVNVFCNQADIDPFINRFVQDAARHRKPVMIAESTPMPVGAKRGEISWKKWYAPFFNLLKKHSHIKAVCYINASWKDYPDRNFRFDCRIQENPLVAENYREALSTQVFINAGRK